MVTPQASWASALKIEVRGGRWDTCRNRLRRFQILTPVSATLYHRAVFIPFIMAAPAAVKPGMFCHL
jgi:hypothetical protein